MKQPVKTPTIQKCHCGKEAKVKHIFGIYANDSQATFYQVQCSNGHSLTKPMGSSHRAICRWNNRLQSLNQNSL